MKYLEYNSGSEPIPIEQIRVPFFLNRDSLKMTVGCVVCCDSVVQRRREQPIVFFRGFLYEVLDPALLVCPLVGVQEVLQGPREAYIASSPSPSLVICENDPTLRRGFLNPFLSSQDAVLGSFHSILTLLEGYSKHGVSPISVSPATSDRAASFEYPIPSDLLRTLLPPFLRSPDELPSYHLDNRSLSIFSESSPRLVRSADSQTNLLRAALARPAERKPVSRALAHEILPLVIVMWDLAEEEEEAEASRALPSRSSAAQLRELLKDSRAASEEKVRLFVRQRAEGRRGGEGGRKAREKPRFVSILVVHFLRNRAPTLIRRLNVCPDGIFVPRVGAEGSGEA